MEEVVEIAVCKYCGNDYEFFGFVANECLCHNCWNIKYLPEIKINDTILINEFFGGNFWKVMKVCKKIIKLRRLESKNEIESEPDKWTTNYIKIPLENFSTHWNGQFINKNIKIEELIRYKDYINLQSFRFRMTYDD